MSRRRLATSVATAILVVLSALAALFAGTTAQAATTDQTFLTFYGWWDNTPPGGDISYPQIHDTAGGVGSYDDPITFATDKNELAPGTRVYYPYLKRYFIMEDGCVECSQDWQNGKRHIDLWAGGERGDADAVINCEDSLTQDSGDVIVDPDPNRPVDSGPLFNSSDNSCYQPSGFAANAEPKSDDGNPTADQLLAKTANCDQVSNGTYSDKNGGQTPICGANGAYFWTSGMAVDCDGQRTSTCNENTDCCFYDDTSFHQSDGKPLDAARLPYVVIPLPSSRWDYGDAGIQGGDVLAVIYHGHVEYAVFGDEGPDDSIGEASYATAKSLGIDPDPKTGGTSDKVTYIVFKNSKAAPIENHSGAVSQGREFAQQFIADN